MTGDCFGARVCQYVQVSGREQMSVWRTIAGANEVLLPRKTRQDEL